MKDVWINGTGMTAFGRHERADVVELAVEAGQRAMADADVEAGDIGAVYLGNFLGQSMSHQGVLASLIARRLGLGTIPTTAVEGACASAGIALRHGLMASRGGTRFVLSLGAEYMSGYDVPEVTRGLAEAMDQSKDGKVGLTFPGFFGLVAVAHGHRYGTTREQMAAVAVKNRAHGANNPLAMFQKPVTVDDVLSARPIADPLGLYDCSPISDGAAAAVVSSEPRGSQPVRVLACEQASGPTSIDQISDLTSFPATRAAAERAWENAGVTARDVDVVELHDCFTIAEIVDSEDLGLLPRGEAAAAVAEGATALGTGEVVVNPSGGLLSRGHPVGATGLAQIHELVQQLRGTSTCQVDGAEVALAHNLGGCGATATVTILAAA